MSIQRKIKILPGFPRYRTQNDLSHLTARRTTKDATCANLGTFETTAPFQAAQVGKLKRIWDTVTPYFRERSARGDIIVTPMEITTETHEVHGNFGQAQSVPPSCTSPVAYAVETYYGPWLSYLLGDPSGDNTKLSPKFLLAADAMSNAVSVATTSAWSKANGHQADILTDIAEIRQTLSLLRDPLKTTSRLLRNIKSKQGRRSRLSGSDALEYFNSQWLQYRFGIRPLVSSVQGVVKALKDVHEKRRSTYRGSYSVYTTETLSGVRTGSILKTGWRYDYTDSYSVRAGMLIEDSVSFADSIGVDASGMLALPWELIPYSFVADWFANVGTFLSSLVPYLTVTPVGSWCTTERVQTVYFQQTSTVPTNPAAYSVLSEGDETRTSVYITKIRTPNISSPSLTWKPQAVDKVLSDLRIADAFSLVANLFFSTFKK